MKSRAAIIYLTVIALVFAIIQADFMPAFYFYGTGPDFLLLLCVCTGFCTEGGFGHAAALAAAAGIIAGSFSSISPAYFIILFETCALLSYRLGKKRVSKTAMLLLSGASASAISALFSFLFLYASGDPQSANEALRMIVPYTVCNMLFIWPIHMIPRSFAGRKSLS